MNSEKQTPDGNFESYKDLPNVVLAEQKINTLLGKRTGEELKTEAKTVIYEMLTRRSEYVRDIEGKEGGVFEYMKKNEAQKNWYRDGLNKIGEWVDNEGKYIID